MQLPQQLPYFVIAVALPLIGSGGIVLLRSLEKCQRRAEPVTVRRGALFCVGHLRRY